MKIRSIVTLAALFAFASCESDDNNIATDLSDSVLLNDETVNESVSEYLILQNDLEGLEEEASEREGEDGGSNFRSTAGAADKMRGKGKNGKHRPFAHYHCADVTREMDWEELTLTKVYDFSNGGCEGGEVVMGGLVTDVIDLDTTETLNTYSFSTTFDAFSRDEVVMEGTVERVRNWEPLEAEDLIDPKAWMKIGRTFTGTVAKNLTVTYPADEENAEGWSETIEKDLTVEASEGEQSRIGTITYSNSLGQGYTTVITTARVFTKNCDSKVFFPVSGVEEVTTLDGLVITINYGDGECDTLAEITIDGVTEVVDLKEVIGEGKINRSAILSRL
ncbi:hypothetical protein [Sediminitomix flava]|uniref:Lipoprotein n=1 Tax=Sediminitomix flava TaxID=379075 RepID=A0A315ZE92_SEDFL|nr:hypothetical protein [Sediminitomix flava]PWJ43138.1 hypothetical protein BC781_102687 [Sediminitomix flava]